MGIWKPTYQPELYHHGVKGMRWGQHKFGKDVFQAGPGGGSGGLLEDEPSDEELKEAEANLERLRKLAQNGTLTNWGPYYKALDNYNQKKAEYDKKMDEYKKTASYAIKNPGETVKKAMSKLDSKVSDTAIDIEYGIKDKLGITAKNAKSKAEKKYNQTKKLDNIYKKNNPKDTYLDSQLAKEKAEVDNATKDYYKTPMGTIDMYKDAIASAKKYRDSPKVSPMDEYYNVEDRQTRSATRSIPLVSDRPRSRKRNITSGGSGVQIRGSVNERPRSRKRNVTSGGSGVQLRGRLKKGK